ncbi:MAG: histidine--tRNA ligase [Zavarzinella sp.]
MAKIIEPRTLRGFRDYPPELMIPRERFMEIARGVFRSYGFAPIDTPALELTEILLAKLEEGAEINKQLFRFTDAGGRDVALRFDLTVPLARFVAQHASKLTLPFKRYHLAPVWRGESPQAGRFREFMQCDFDILGTATNYADIEIALVMNHLLESLGFDRFSLHVNNRKILNGLLTQLGIVEHTTAVLRVLDKLPKVGAAAALEEMGRETPISTDQAQAVIDLAATVGSNVEILEQLRARFADNPAALQGVADLHQMNQVFREVGIPEHRLKIDLSICRGLDYYTGTVYETFLHDKREIGSVCSGGRYDNLTGSYTKNVIPGVGASLGLDRLLAAMDALNMLPTVATPVPVLIFQLDEALLGDYHRFAHVLRSHKIGVELFPDSKKLGQQFQYAEKKGFRVGLLAGTTERQQNQWKVKDLHARTEVTVAESEVLAEIQRILAVI